MDSLAQLSKIITRYAKDANLAPAAVGSISFKQQNILYYAPLCSAGKNSFTGLDIGTLKKLPETRFPEKGARREAALLAGVRAAAVPGCADFQPDAGCILHALLPYPYVLYLHPAPVLGMTCGQNGKAACGSIFPDAAWVPFALPGHAQVQSFIDTIGKYGNITGAAPKLAFFQNGGMLVAGDSAEQLEKNVQGVLTALAGKTGAAPDFSPAPPPASAQSIAPVLRALYAKQQGPAIAVFCANRNVLDLVRSRHSADALALPYTPEQAAHCGGRPLYVTPGSDLAGEFEVYVQKYGHAPGIVLVEDTGFFAMGKNKKEADGAFALFLCALQAAACADSFGGPRGLTDADADSILKTVRETNTPDAPCGRGRMDGKICVVTGGAQGFGAGIARGIARQGGYVVVADMNEKGARALATELEEEFGAGAATGIEVNVTDEQSVAGMVEQATLRYGGVDVMVSCAGILKAGDLDAMTVDDFEKVTKVNYTGYFLCTKYASVPMKTQRRYAPDYTADIIEINSKSGLEGSKANFAYAGSKFGGIGLTQSFALELVSFGIKVNAICPGNLLDGPLWSDPEKGLFRQYLDAGKVPGAKTVDEVRRFYESKVPMGRGCREQDVVAALLYLVEQQYETGQALPVTGGQVMLK